MRTVSLIGLCLLAGFLTIAVPSWMTLARPGAAAATQAPPVPPDAVAEARKEAQAAGKAACAALMAYDRVKECAFVEYIPAIDIRIGEGRLAIEEICGRASDIVAGAAPQIASPWLKVRVFLSAVVPPTAACRRG